jgi:hypothetical protein
MPASYRDLGPTALITATPDQTFNNTGNWTIVAGPTVLNCYVALAEIYQIAVDGPIGSGIVVARNTRIWNQVVQGWQNNYDPSNPLFVRPTDTIFLYWKAPIVWLPVPTATFWLRYDVDLPENKQITGGS